MEPRRRRNLNCRICSLYMIHASDRCKLTSKIKKRPESVGDVLSNWGISISEEDDEILICRPCNSVLSTLLIRQNKLNMGLIRLYNKCSPSQSIGCKLRTLISGTRLVTLVPPEEINNATPSSSGKSSQLQASGVKRPNSTDRTEGTPSRTGVQVEKKCKLSRSTSLSKKQTLISTLNLQTNASGIPSSIPCPPSPTPRESPMECGQAQPEAEVTGVSKMAAQYLSVSKYKLACGLLRRKSKCFTREICKMVEEEAREEIRNICKLSSRSVWRSAHNGDKLKSYMYQSFSWKGALAEARTQCPFLYAAVSGAATASRSKRKRRVKKGVIARWLKPTVGAIFGMLSYLGNAQTMRLLQELVSLELWLSNCGNETFTRLSHLGICISWKATNSMMKDFDRAILEKKKQLEALGTSTKARPVSSTCTEEPVAAKDKEDGTDKEQAGFSGDDLSNLSVSSIEELEQLSDSSDAGEIPSSEKEDEEDVMDEAANSGDENILALSSVKDLVDPLPDGTEANATEANTTGAGTTGYTITFDNVNEMKHIRCGTRLNRNEKLLKMVQAYAAFDRVPSHHLDDKLPTADDILQIDPHAYLPNEEDEILLRKEYKVIVQRALTQLMPCFEKFAEQVEDHIPHRYSEESSQKSTIVQLGVLNKDETSTADMVDILSSYHKYVPRRDSKPITTVLYGEGFTCEHARDAQNARIKEETTWDRLEGLHPSVQEWHKQGLLLEDTYKLLYDLRSLKAVGTLCYIKSKFKYKTVQQNRVMHTFDLSTDMLQLATDAYVVAAACVFMGIDDPSKTPADFPEGLNGGFQYLQDVASSVVGMVLPPVEVAGESENEPDHHCICRSDIEDDMVLCENPSCRRGTWFHFSCMNMTPEDVPEGAFFCSTECSVASKTPKEEVCQPTTDDHILQYSKAVLFRGLGDRVRSDAVRENDGDRMISHWRFDMVDFHEKQHTKYFTEGFHLLSDLNGGASERMAHQLRWNRTVNVCGGRGQNISTDLSMDHLNKEFRRAVKSWGSKMTASQVQRYSKVLGLCPDYRRIFGMRSKYHGDGISKPQNQDMNKDTMELAKLLLDNKCLEHIPGRSHSGFQDFVFTHALSQEEKFIERIEECKEKRAECIEIVQGNV